MRTVVALVLALGVVAAAWAADALVNVSIDGKPQAYKAIVRNGSAYVPLRAGATSLGYTVDYQAKEQMVSVSDKTTHNAIKVSDGIVVQESLYLPLRQMAESFKCVVKWDAKEQTVQITKPKAGGG